MTVTMRPCLAACSPLLDEHRALGARFTDFAGWQMPVRYGSELTEYHAVRSAAGLFDLSHMGEIEIVGPHAAAVLDYALVGSFGAVKTGKAKYSLLCAENGGVLDDLVAYRLAEHRFLVVANAANTAAVHAALTQRAAGFNATVTDRSAQMALIALQGPVAERVLCRIIDPTHVRTVTGLKYYAATELRIGTMPILLARTGYTGEDGFELYVSNDRAIDLWWLLLDAGAAHGVVPAGLACRDTLRMEAGMPLYGNELSLETSPYDAGLGRTVRLDKDFVGRDALAQYAKWGPLRNLVGLQGIGKRAARTGYAVYTMGGAHRIGTVTSGALSPTLGYPIAMCYVAAGSVELGSVVSVDIRGSDEPFRVVPTPFYSRV
ncbi:glycine cleavage system protein T [Mycobacterium intermedium]|uniref:Aminomethyltransferase n=1 Tax=Mycobacterium intermedium TaxID=28445 RepID=A0A1E3SAZ7_MYCIE|nr:glycine cleavage system aminomethyltransferase GcvT [Mycobacterium intermedium]MCV6967444.1 glycine cleavage system aminomethyltransferase GcvT [Mycobacterium intermedium]ODQ99336.1 glycine cleavage system protein T [Mycobacterium intermedium]OPE50003.1 glycine cleavage system protein T [Mycobacterium intermedium]ORB07794.1 glycine cleavage system protein T [Mycobacterium intermedium]